jgi:hypothetical protein
MEKLTRNYSVKDVDMIITASTIIKNAISQKNFLQSKRSSWSGTYFEDLENRIDAIAADYLGADNARELRISTAAIYEARDKAHKLASEIKVQIEEDFPAEKTEMLRTLGYTSYFAKARQKDQEALINLLFQFKANLTPALKAQMTANGILPTDLDALAAMGEELKALDTVQEAKKGARPINTEEAVRAFNDIYEQVMAVARIASRFYKDDRPRQDLFSFSKIAKAINTHNNTPK